MPDDTEAEIRGQKRCREAEEGEILDELPTASSAPMKLSLPNSSSPIDTQREHSKETHDLDFIQALLEANQNRPNAALDSIPDTGLEEGEEEEQEEEEPIEEQGGGDDEIQETLDEESEHDPQKEEEEEEDTLAAKAAALLARRQPSTTPKAETSTKEVKPKVTSCQVCHVAEPKYTCPRCSLQTCSLSCVKRHKAEQECSGVRDAAAFVAFKEYDEVDMHKDLHFLEEMTRLAENSARETLPLVQQTSSKPQRPQRNNHRGRFHKKRKMQKGRA